MEDSLRTGIIVVTRGLEVLGIAVILIGALIALVQFATPGRGPEGTDDRIYELRSGLGRSILLGLEFLVAADIVNTVAVEPTLTSVAVLAGIVLIRTFLSFSLEVEIEGRWPWQRQSGKGRETPSRPD